MVPEPELEQVGEDLLAGQVRVVEEGGLRVPVPAQLAADLLAEERELIELLLCLVAEEVEPGVVVDVMLLRPLALA